MATSWLMGQELPEGWELARDRPHPLLEAVSRPTPTIVHVVIARDWAELIDKLQAIAARDVA